MSFNKDQLAFVIIVHPLDYGFYEVRVDAPMPIPQHPFGGQGMQPVRREMVPSLELAIGMVGGMARQHVEKELKRQGRLGLEFQSPIIGSSEDDE